MANASVNDSTAAAARSRWTREEDKLFENCLADFAEDSADRWERIAAHLRTKSAAEVEQHYAVLLEDVTAIEAGLIDPPAYSDEPRSGSSQPPQPCPKPGAQRKAAKPWTEKEHRLFLLGLEKYGKGDWKSISRLVVLTRSSTQVASHAQKHFQHMEKEDQDKKRRRSIFDTSSPQT